MKYVLASLLAIGLIGGTASATDGGDTLTGDRITGDNIKSHQTACSSDSQSDHCLTSDQKKKIKKKLSSAKGDGDADGNGDGDGDGYCNQ